jgi:hypothetical protein
MLVVTFIFVSNLSAVKIDVTAPPQGRFYDQYYSLYIGTTKCGWASYSLERQKDRILAANKTHMEIGRDNLVIAVDVTTKTQETLDAKPLKFESEVSMAGSKTIYRGEFTGNKVRMEIEQAGQITEHKFALPADTTMAWGDYLLTRKYLEKTGSSYTTNSFDPTLGPGKVAVMKVQVAGPAEARIAGRKISGIKLITQAELLGPMPIISYCDKDGNMLATEMQVGFLKVQMVAEEKQQAVAGIKPEEIFTNTFVKLSEPLTFGKDQPLRLKLSATGESAMPALPETAKQKIVSRDDKTVVLEILPPGKRWLGAKEDKLEKVTLSSSSYVKLDDPLLVELAKKAAGSANDPRKIARNLCQFVHEYIETKNLATPFASASEVAKTKSGDCSEHAVLLAGLARIKGIASRAVAGLVYTRQGGPNGSFGYHMWTQLWLDDHWVDVDATFNQPEADQTHIALSHWDLADDTFIDQAVKLVPFIGQLEIGPEKSK